MRSYRAFISYSHSDEKAASALHKRLETYRPPRLADGDALVRLSPVFRDRDELATSSDLGGRIEEALRASENLIVLCSPRSAASQWVNQEIRAFAAQHGSDRIHPVIVDGAPPACFPPALLEVNEEPLAADLRADKDGFEDGALKLIAGVLGAPFGVLKDREAARARRRFRLLAAVAVVFAGLTAAAVYAAYVAVQETARAEAQLQRAETAITAAVGGIEGVVGGIADNTSAGMMRSEAAVDLLSTTGDVADQVTEIAPDNPALRLSSAALKVEFAETYAETGQADLAERFANEALALIGDGTGEASQSLLRIRALSALGEAALRRGDAATADDLLVDAQEAAAASGVQIVEAQILGQRAEVARLAGDIHQAAELADREVEINEALHDLTMPETTARYVEALLRQEKIAAASGLTQTATAAAVFAEMMSERLTSGKAPRADYQILRGRALSRLAAIKQRDGDLESAADLAAEAVVIGRTILRDDPRSLPKMTTLVDALSTAAQIYKALGRTSDRRIALTQAATLAQELTIADPVNVFLSESYAQREFALSDLLFDLGEREEASRRQNAAVDVFRRLAAAAPDDAAAKAAMAEVALRRARAHLRLGEYGDAIFILKEASSLANEAANADPDDDDAKRQLADLIAAAAVAWHHDGDRYLALKFHGDARGLYKSLAASRPSDMSLIVAETNALIGIGRALSASGEKEAALAPLIDATRKVGPHYHNAPENALLARAYVEAAMERGWQILRFDDPAIETEKKALEASAYLGEARFILKGLQKRAPDDLELKTLFGMIEWAGGDLYYAQGGKAEAYAAYADALQVFEELLKVDPDAAIWVESAGRLTMKLGQMRKAQRRERYGAALAHLDVVESRASLTPEAQNAARFLRRRLRELANE